MQMSVSLFLCFSVSLSVCLSQKIFSLNLNSMVNSWVLYSISLFQIKAKYMKELVKWIHQLIQVQTKNLLWQTDKQTDRQTFAFLQSLLGTENGYFDMIIQSKARDRVVTNSFVCFWIKAKWKYKFCFLETSSFHFYQQSRDPLLQLSFIYILDSVTQDQPFHVEKSCISLCK